VQDGLSVAIKGFTAFIGFEASHEIILQRRWRAAGARVISKYSSFALSYSTTRLATSSSVLK